MDDFHPDMISSGLLAVVRSTMLTMWLISSHEATYQSAAGNVPGHFLRFQ